MSGQKTQRLEDEQADRQAKRQMVRLTDTKTHILADRLTH